MAYSRYATELKDKENNIYGIMDEEARDYKADAINVTLDTPASVMSFSDGADSLPMALTVGIEPVQDLHGLDNPYPAGGSKNIFPLTVAGIKAKNTSGTWNGNVYTVNSLTFTLNTDSDGNITSIKVNGTASANTSMVFNDTSAMLTVPGTGVTVTISSGVNNSNYYLQADGYSNGTYIKTIEVGHDNYPTHTYSGTLTFGTIRIYITNGSSLSNIELKPQIEIGSSATTFAPYSNICPISGWTGANVGVTAKNLVDFGLPYTTESSGVTNHYATQFVLPKVEEYIRCSGKCSDGTVLSDVAIVWLNSSNQQVWNIGTNRANKVPSNISDVVAIRIYTPATYAGKTVTEFQVEYVADESGTATAYEPYNSGSAQYTITFPSSAGTVYGGTLTVNKDGSGELVVDKGMWTKNTSTMNNNENVPGWKWAGVAELIGTGYNASFNATMNIGTKYSANTIGSNDILFLDKLFYSKTQTEWQALAMDVQIVVVLATPVTYSLTPGQVKTLLGVNNIWADTGDVLSVTYPADTKLYIDKKFAELSAAITALGT